MTKREKTLGLLVGLMILLLAAWLGMEEMSDVFRRRQQQVSMLQRQIADKQFSIMSAQAEADRLAVYQRRSLPADHEKALALYQNWLLNSVTDVGLEDPRVNVVTSRGDTGGLHRFSFTVSGTGDLPRLVDFLYRFYSVDYLHRIRRLHAKRIRDSKRLDLAFSIEAVSLPTSDSTDQLSDHRGFDLAQGDITDYLKTILERNISGPANRPPQFRSPGNKTVTVQDSISMEITASDPDNIDSVSYSLDGEVSDSIRFDPKTGRFSWRPREIGQYEFVVTATDDGIPSRSDRVSFTVTVVEPEPEPPEPPQPEPEPDFGSAKFAFVTAITEVDGQRQTWISLRSEGKLLKLKEGDQFTIGDVQVIVRHIDARQVEVEAKELDLRLLVALGESLADGERFSSSEL